MGKGSSNIRIIKHGLRMLAGYKKIHFGKGALLAFVACTLVLGAVSASFSAPAVGSPYYLECKVYVMSNSDAFASSHSVSYWHIISPVFNEETNLISYEDLGPFNTSTESIYYPPYSSAQMGRIYYWTGHQWTVWQYLSHFPIRKSIFHAFEASASIWADAVLPFDSNPTDFFPNGCSDLPSKQPEQLPNFDPGSPECPLSL